MAIDMFYNRAAALEELYKVDEEEINVSVPDADGKMVKKYGNLNNTIKAFKTELNKYYVEEIGPKLLKYGFIK